MNEHEQAIEHDINQEYLLAIKSYETIISSNENLPIEIFSNLSFIYWAFASDSAFRDAYGISDDWGLLGDERDIYILNLGLLKYPNSVELKFWSKYYPHRYYFDEFTQNQCLSLVTNSNAIESLVPYFFLYLFDEEKYKRERDELLIECNKTLTAKNKYIKSLIE